MIRTRLRYRMLVALLAVAGFFAGAVSVAGPAQAATSKALPYTFQWQQNGYYCGPAATRIALTALGHTYSQDYLAGQLGTTTDGTSGYSA